MSSPFLAAPESSWVASNDLAFALLDAFPVSRGHTLVIPRRLIATWFDATPEERAAIFALVDDVKRRLDSELRPDGYNIGINAGEAAGQTVMHLHVHVIPRFRGDVEDPRGGVRHVIPGKGNYLLGARRPLATGGTADPFLHHLTPLFAAAAEIAILAAFVQESGLDQLEGEVFRALERGARVRLITGDYLHITQATALVHLLDWASGNSALSEDGSRRGSFETRVVEVESLPSESRSFHPKSWRFEGPAFGAAFVGSSNISRSALRAGIEWNLRVDRHRDPDAYQAVVAAFERWWTTARPLTADWVEAYARRAGTASKQLPLGEEEATPLAAPPPPHAIQEEALAELKRCREEEHWGRALVVLATGLGKTYLAALDVVQWASLHGRMPRVLVLAHREELLFQVAKTFRRLLRERAPRFTWFSGALSDLDGDVVLASVQKLSRPDHLPRLTPDRFDYVIVDEVHHGTAPSYRGILDRIEPSFLLGLTATPERADGADLLGLFDDHVAYRADLGTGIESKLLVPFSYWGLRDDTDFGKVSFRNRRFDPGELESAIDTEPRLLKLLEAWQSHPGSRTLVFCCSIRHAENACQFLVSRGVRAVALHSGPTSAPREQALADLVSGKLDALCTVDLFNEGVDLPDVDRVVMLRPTESPVVFLQQLGRGLRVSGSKERLTVLDFVGNHRVFLDRVRTLLSLGPAPTELRDFIEGTAAPRLPSGCSIHIELEAKSLLASLLPPRQERDRTVTSRSQGGARQPSPASSTGWGIARPHSGLRTVDGSTSSPPAEGPDRGRDSRPSDRGGPARSKCWRDQVLLQDGDPGGACRRRALLRSIPVSDLSAGASLLRRSLRAGPRYRGRARALRPSHRGPPAFRGLLAEESHPRVGVRPGQAMVCAQGGSWSPASLPPSPGRRPHRGARAAWTIGAGIRDRRSETAGGSFRAKVSEPADRSSCFLPHRAAPEIPEACRRTILDGSHLLPSTLKSGLQCRHNPMPATSCRPPAPVVRHRRRRSPAQRSTSASGAPPTVSASGREGPAQVAPALKACSSPFPTLRAAAGAPRTRSTSPEAEHVRLPVEAPVKAVRGARHRRLDGWRKSLFATATGWSCFARGISAAELDGKVALL
ncbi:MAG: DEAD/DEAH box helicase family protein [Polyangiaceae bacterium]